MVRLTFLAYLQAPISRILTVVWGGGEKRCLMIDIYLDAQYNGTRWALPNYLGSVRVYRLLLQVLYLAEQSHQENGEAVLKIGWLGIQANREKPANA